MHFGDVSGTKLTSATACPENSCSHVPCITKTRRGYERQAERVLASSADSDLTDRVWPWGDKPGRCKSPVVPYAVTVLSQSGP